MGRSFDDLPRLNCQQAVAVAGPPLIRPQGVIFAMTIFVGVIGAVSAGLPTLEWALRCILNAEAPQLGRLACLGSSIKQCWHVLLWRFLGFACSVLVIYVTVSHFLVYHLIFKYRTGVHLRVRGSDEFEKQLELILRKEKVNARRRGCNVHMHSASSMLDCVDQWQRIALGLLGLCIAMLAFFRELDRCSRHHAQPEPPGCCRATWMDEDRADDRVVFAMTVGLPLSALSWFAFDDARGSFKLSTPPFSSARLFRRPRQENIREQWRGTPGFDDPIPIDMNWGQESERSESRQELPPVQQIQEMA